MTCPNCVEGFVLPGEPTGSIQGDYDGAYYAPAPSVAEEAAGGEASRTGRAIVLLTDGFGLELKNPNILADTLARRVGCDVWVPDYFKRRPLVAASNLRTPDRAGVKLSVWDWIGFICSTIPYIPAFISRSSRPAVVDKRVGDFITLVKEKKHYEKIGMVGYCYGGSTTARFAGTKHIDSAVVCHPGGVSLAEVQAIRVPTSWACAEDDLFWPSDKRLKTEVIFAERMNKGSGVEYEFKDYKGTAHGFAARPNLNLPEVKAAHEKALDQTVDWFKKTLN